MATNAVRNNPSLQKVVIMEDAPRFDDYNVDPTGLKPELAKYANSTFYQILNSSALKDRKVIGKHSLECSGNIIAARYRDDKNNKYDGVHLNNNFGMRAYTRSVTKVLQTILHAEPTLVHTSSPASQQSRHHNSQKSSQQNRQQNSQQNSRQNNEYSVPIYNRFNVLGN